MNTFKHYIGIALCFVGLTTLAQTTIVKEGNYTVTGSESLNASQSITLKPNSWIKSGSDFSVRINENSYSPVVFSNNQNYIFSRVFQVPMTSSSNIQRDQDVIESITYFDGLGRPKQQIGIKATPGKKDLVTHIAYDDYGRQDKEYLPFEASGSLGTYKNVNVQEDINRYYQNKYPNDFSGMPLDEVNAHTQYSYERSPLQRVEQVAAPGKSWRVDVANNHTIKSDWITNRDEDIPYFRVNFHLGNTELPILVQDEFYAPQELYLTITKDENWTAADGDNHTIHEYNDKQGRVILKRAFNQGDPHDTHYVYDDFGNLTYVIPPKVNTSDGVSSTELSELCYQYVYDYRNRLVEKQLPGKGKQYIIYNKLDQPILTQDAVQRPNRKWTFTKYDAFGRVVFTGIETFPWETTRAGLQQNLDNDIDAPQYERRTPTSILVNGTRVYYSNDTFPGGGEIITVNYYDDYEVGDIVTFNPANGSGTWEGMTATTQVKGLPTVSQLRVLNTDDWITTATYYDPKGRPWETHVKNDYLNTEDWVLNQLDFIGKILKTRSMHIKGGTTITTVDSFTYDHIGRLLTQTQKINDHAEEQLISNTYDELGQLTKKTVGGGLQEVDYAYNVRGWLTSINGGTTEKGDLFGFAINYDKTSLSGSSPLFNGNISETHWKTVNDNIPRNYRYTYDALNRITSGISQDGKYDLNNVRYDKNGNINEILRYGWQNSNKYTDMDILYMEYDQGNKLVNTKDYGNRQFGFTDQNPFNGVPDYAYDLNGNMTEDLNKGITDITYNHLNLPSGIEIDGNEHTGYINYAYDAAGMKMKKTVQEIGNPTTLITEYAGNFSYQNNKLQFFNHPEGYIEPIDPTDYTKGFEYIYQYKDHLGNIRLSYSDIDNDGKVDVLRNNQDIDGDGDNSHEIKQEKNYYPFGLEHNGYNSTIIDRDHPYKFNGIEHEQSLALDLYEMPLRQYDPSIARWTSIDPVTHHSQSTYSAFDGNPVFWADPSGASVEQTENGTTYTGEHAKVAFLNLRNQYGGAGTSDSNSSEEGVLNADGTCCANSGSSNSVEHRQTLSRRAHIESLSDEEREAYLEEEKDFYITVGTFAIPLGGVARLISIGGKTFIRIYQGTKVVKTVQISLSSFSHAGKYGIQSYSKLRKLIEGTGLHAHHLIEKRFAPLFGQKAKDMASIVLTKAEHDVFTAAWRAEIGLSNWTSKMIRTDNATKQQVIDAAKRIYENYPEILKALGL